MKRKNGITLIALVITIIVLLILAGVSISALMGDNGILTNASNASEQSLIGTEKEQLSVAYSSCKADNAVGSMGIDAVISASQLQSKMNSSYGSGKVDVEQVGNLLTVKYLNTNRLYSINQDGIVLHLSKIFEEVIPSGGSVTKIGIDEYGNLVNMNNWLCIYDSEEDGWILAEELGSYANAAYVGDIVDGEIEGNMPMYIVSLTGSGAPTEFKPVIGLHYTFYGLSDLTVKPEIPSTVLNPDNWSIFHGTGISE